VFDDLVLYFSQQTISVWDFGKNEGFNLIDQIDLCQIGQIHKNRAVVVVKGMTVVFYLATHLEQFSANLDAKTVYLDSNKLLVLASTSNDNSLFIFDVVNGERRQKISFGLEIKKIDIFGDYLIAGAEELDYIRIYNFSLDVNRKILAVIIPPHKNVILQETIIEISQLFNLLQKRMIVPLNVSSADFGL